MTIIVAAHLGDCVLIAADKRAMACNPETGTMTLSTDYEQKIKLWNRGAFIGTGETLFLNRVAQYFVDYQDSDGFLRQMDVIYEELEKRVLEGVPQEILQYSTIIFSVFNGDKTLLYSIPIEQFFDFLGEGRQSMTRSYMHEIKERDVTVACFNIPPDMTSFQNFQKNIQPLKYFNEDKNCILYYIDHLKEVFSTHARIDPSITASFDLYIQSCETGRSIAMHIQNYQLPTTNSENLNFWDKVNGI